MTQRTTTPAPDYLTPGQAAALAGVTTRTILRYASDGRLPSVELPTGHRRYRRADVEALLSLTASP